MSSCTPICSICGLSLDNSEVVTVGEKGIQGLVKASQERGDARWRAEEGIQSIVLHKECRRVYTHPSSIARDRKLASSAVSPTLLPTTTAKSKLRNSVDGFDLRTCCLFCGEKIDYIAERKKEERYRRGITKVESLNFLANVLDVARQRDDPVSCAVLRRLGGVIDLVAAGGIYHQDCLTKFYKPAKGVKRGRPESENVAAAMEEIYQILDESDECQFSIREITENLTFVPETKTIKEKLKQKYGDGILISSQKNNEMVMCFRRTGDKTLSNSWYSQRKLNEQDERLRIVRTAAAIILEDVKSLVSKLGTHRHDNPAPHEKILQSIKFHILHRYSVKMRIPPPKIF